MIRYTKEHVVPRLNRAINEVRAERNGLAAGVGRPAALPATDAPPALPERQSPPALPAWQRSREQAEGRRSHRKQGYTLLGWARR